MKAKRINNLFRRAVCPKQGVGRAELVEVIDDDYATAAGLVRILDARKLAIPSLRSLHLGPKRPSIDGLFLLVVICGSGG